jgi:hypothetical protein
MAKEIHILMGLPGSGKTFWRNTKYPNNMSNVLHVDIDRRKELFEEYNDDNTSSFDPIETIQKHFVYFNNSNSYNTLIIDGPIFTNSIIEDILNSISDFLKRLRDRNSFIAVDSEDMFEVTIHHWRENRENCLFNDKYRRELSSEATIRNAIYELPNVEKYNTKFSNIKVEYHDIVKKSVYDACIAPYGWTNNGKLISDTWSGGGTWGDCWGNEGRIDSDIIPEFIKFDELIEQICPNITFIQYKKLHNACVEQKYRYEYDYYGGSEKRMWWECDLKHLYQTLINMKVITE